MPNLPIGDDEIANTGLSGMGNERASADDKEAVDSEQTLLHRLSPVLDVVNNAIEDEIDQLTNIRSLIMGDPKTQPDPERVVIELRARELHLNFLEKFRAKVKNSQNTIEELRTNG